MKILIATSFMLLCGTFADALRSRVNKRYVGSGSGAAAGAGAFSGAGFGDYGFASPPFDFPGFVDPLEFQKSFHDYFASLQKQQAAAATMTYSSDNATASAKTFLSPNNNLFRQQFEHQNALFDSIRRQAGTSYGSSGPNYAAASAAYGPGGIHQTAYISPPNPAHPNVNTRFSSSGGGPGFYGVSTSSFSQSADINGKKSNRRGSITRVNDNGKVTTYQTHS